MYVWSFTARCLDDVCHLRREHFRVQEEGVGEDHPTNSIPKSLSQDIADRKGLFL